MKIDNFDVNRIKNAFIRDILNHLIKLGFTYIDDSLFDDLVYFYDLSIDNGFIPIIKFIQK